MGEYRLTPDGVQARRATRGEIDQLFDTDVQMRRLNVPHLLATPKDRVFVAAMDGTGNHASRDGPFASTVVAQIADRIESLGQSAISITYVPGVGTQRWPLVALADRAFANSFEARVEHAYHEFCLQASRWLQEDPDAHIHLAGVGFSRGAESLAALQHMVDERGIRDPVGARVRYGSDGILARIEWPDAPPLVPPSKTAQVAILIDPVASGLRDIERRLPSSNIGALQFTSLDERRGHYPITMHLARGLSEEARAANLFLPGAHSDAGGAYLIDGIGRFVHNASVDYLNGVFGKELLSKVALPDDPRIYVVHASDQHLYGLYPTDHYSRHGVRLAHTDLSPECAPVAVVCSRAPVDVQLAGRFQWRQVQPAPVPPGTDTRLVRAGEALARMYGRTPDWLDHAVGGSSLPGRAEVLKARDVLQAKFDELYEATLRGDLAGTADVVRAWVQTPAGMAFKPAHDVARAWWQHAEGPQANANGRFADMEARAPQSPPSGMDRQASPALVHP